MQKSVEDVGIGERFYENGEEYMRVGQPQDQDKFLPTHNAVWAVHLDSGELENFAFHVVVEVDDE